MNAKDVDRFWSRVNRDGACWLWQGVRMSSGYGKFWLNNRTRLAHRVAYEAAIGPIPDGLQIDHLCRVPGCVRPDHLEAVTPQTNTLRSTNLASQNARKDRCAQGHPFDEANTGFHRRAGRVERVCKACGRAKEKRSRERKALRAAGVAA